MENEFILLSGELKALSYVLKYSDYIQRVTDDADFTTSIIRVFSDYLSYKADYCLKVSENERDGYRKD